MRKHQIQDLPKGLEIAHADDVVDMHDDPAAVVHKRKNSSMIVGLKMLADGDADAFVSAGSTGALLTGATLLVKRVKGVRRAAFGPVMPNKAGGKTLIIDCGANVECTPEFLLQFGVVGSLYARKASWVLHSPRVGLLNIGDGGVPRARPAATGGLCPADPGWPAQVILHFVGNAEAREVPLGAGGRSRL